MRRLINFELGKLLKNKILWVLAILMLAFNIFDLWNPWAEPIVYREAYGPLVSGFERLEKMSEEELQEAVEYFQYVQENDVEQIGADGKALPGKYFETVPYDIIGGSFYSNYVQRNDRIIENRRSIVDAARRLGRDALAAGDDYNVRRNIEVINTYTLEPKLDLIPERGWEKYFTYGLYDILVLLLIVGTVAVSFSSEKESGAYLLLATSKNGKGKTVAAKVISAGILAFGLSFVFSLLNLLFFYIRYGMWSLSTPLIELESFINSPFTMSVGQYLIIFVLFKAFGAVVLSLLIGAISSLCDSNLKAYAISAAFLGLSYGYSYLVTGPSKSELFHLFDVTLWTRPLDYFGRFFTANCFGYPVEWYWLHLAFALVIGGATYFITYVAYTKKPQRVK